MIEGAKLTVCSECAKHGTIIWEEPKQKHKLSEPAAAKTMPKPVIKPQGVAAQHKTVENELELVEDFDVKIRLAREKMGLTHEDLGKKINEKVSVLKKIETRKIKPDDRLAAKLEHALKIKLLVPPSEEKVPKAAVPKTSNRELTLGDLIKLDKGKAEEKS